MENKVIILTSTKKMLWRKPFYMYLYIISSGHITYPGFLSYSMTKHALVSFADGLRREMLKWNVGVVSIEPTMYKYVSNKKF